MILVVDDDEGVRGLLVQALEDEGYTVVAAGPENAMATALARQPQIILLDLMMPWKDGATLSQELRDTAATSHIPIVGVSARPRERAPANFLVNDWIAKPFDLDELYSVVKRWYRGLS